jgi:hypothetical protein
MTRVRAFLFLTSDLLFSQSCFAVVSLLQRAALKAQLRKACNKKDTTLIFKLTDEAIAKGQSNDKYYQGL